MSLCIKDIVFEEISLEKLVDKGTYSSDLIHLLCDLLSHDSTKRPTAETLNKRTNSILFKTLAQDNHNQNLSLQIGGNEAEAVLRLSKISVDDSTLNSFDRNEDLTRLELISTQVIQRSVTQHNLLLDQKV